MNPRIPNSGYAKAIPNTDFDGHAGERAGLSPIAIFDLQFALDKLSRRFALKRSDNGPSDSKNALHCSMPLSSEHSLAISFILTPASELPDQAVCAYQITPPHSATVWVSEGCHHDHLERGLVHELAELNFAFHLNLKHGLTPERAAAEAVFSNHLLEEEDSSLTQRLTPHDVGRISELDYVFGVRGSGEVSVKEQWHTLVHMGLNSEMTGHRQRLALLENLPASLIDPRTLKHIALRQDSPPQPSIIPTPERTSSPKTSSVSPAGGSTTNEEFEQVVRPETTTSTENTEHQISEYHATLSERLAEALDHAVKLDRIWSEAKTALKHAEDAYTEAAGDSGKKLRHAEDRCKTISETLQSVRQNPNSHKEIVDLQVQLRQAHFELGKLREAHNNSLSETEVRDFQWQIQTQKTREDKKGQDARDGLKPALELILKSMDLARNPNRQWANHQLEQLRKAMVEQDTILRESLNDTLIPAIDAKDNVNRLERDLIAIEQQLERVEVRNNNQRQIDSLGQRKVRIQKEIERAKGQLQQKLGAYASIWATPSVLEQRAHLNALVEDCQRVAKNSAAGLSDDEGPRMATRSARLSAIERQIQLTLEQLLGFVSAPMNAFVQGWSEPDSDLTEAEAALAQALKEDKAWEYRDQLRDMHLQWVQLKYPLPEALPSPTDLQQDAS